MNFIRILPGDKVTVQMSPYDLTRGGLLGVPSNKSGRRRFVTEAPAVAGKPVSHPTKNFDGGKKQ